LIVSVCLVTWNCAKYLPTCLAALKRQDYPNLEIVIVDNGSQDESLRIAREKIPNAVFICNSGNLGFCGGHNQGIRVSNGEYYLSLNPDITMNPGYIANLVETLDQSPEYGMAGGKLFLNEETQGKNIIDSSGLFINRKRQQYLRGFGQEDHGQFDNIQEVFGIDGAAPLYRRKMLDNACINGEYFDEAFFAHKEDVDLAWRSRLLGWKAVYNPKAVAYHVRSFRPGTRDRVNSTTRTDAVKNRYYLLLKNESKVTFRRDWAQILWYDLQIWIYILLKERSSLKAISLIKKDWPRLLSWRKEIWSHVKVHDEDIQSWFVND
jgi:GT2 family glycosyltransferase